MTDAAARTRQGRVSPGFYTKRAESLPRRSGRRPRNPRADDRTTGEGAGAPLTSLVEEMVPQLLQLLEGTDVEALRVEDAGWRITILRAAPAARPLEVLAESAPLAGQDKEEPSPAVGAVPERHPGSAAPATAAHVEVTSPVVGVFRAGKGPGAPPLVSEGDYVERGEIIGFVECMGLLNDVEALAAGQVGAALVEDGQPVEYGQRLFSIEPSTE